MRLEARKQESTLRQVLSAFEDSREPRSLSQIARELDVSPVRLEGMIQYWVRKGKIRQAASYGSCGTCGHNDGRCPFVLAMPRQYELVTATDLSIPLMPADFACSQHRQKKI